MNIIVELGNRKKTEKNKVERLTMFSNLYYNKKIDLNKHFYILNYYHKKFLDNFINGLPKFFDAVDRKNNKKNVLKKEDGVKKKFIFFNSQVIKFLIVDIDDKKTFENKYEIIEFLNDYNIIPSYVLDSQKGYHVGFILKKAIPFSNKKAVDFARDTLKKLSLLLGGDQFALRLKGRFRNPLLHDTYYTNFEYDLSDLIEGVPYFIGDLEIQHNKNKKVHKNITELKSLVLKVLNNINYIKNVEIGYRNSFLWYLGMIIAKNFQHLPTARKLVEFEKIEKQICLYNNNFKNKLEDKEIQNIIKSVKGYYMSNKITVGMGNFNNWTPEMKNIYKKNYRKNKGITKEHREEKKEKNKNKVLQSIYQLKKEKEKTTMRNIQKKCNLSLRTIKKYVDELKEDPRFSSLFPTK